MSLKKIRLFEAGQIDGLKKISYTIPNRGVLYLYHNSGEEARRVYELIDNVLIPLLTYKQTGPEELEFFNLKGKKLEFKMLQQAIIGTKAVDPATLEFEKIKTGPHVVETASSEAVYGFIKRINTYFSIYLNSFCIFVNNNIFALFKPLGYNPLHQKQLFLAIICKINLQ